MVSGGSEPSGNPSLVDEESSRLLKFLKKKNITRLYQQAQNMLLTLKSTKTVGTTLFIRFQVYYYTYNLLHAGASLHIPGNKAV